MACRDSCLARLENPVFYAEQEKEEELMRLMNGAVKEANKGNLKVAEDALRTAISLCKRDQNKLTAIENLAIVLARQKRFNDALDLLNPAINRNLGDWRALRTMRLMTDICAEVSKIGLERMYLRVLVGQGLYESMLGTMHDLGISYLDDSLEDAQQCLQVALDGKRIILEPEDLSIRVTRDALWSVQKRINDDPWCNISWRLDRAPEEVEWRMNDKLKKSDERAQRHAFPEGTMISVPISRYGKHEKDIEVKGTVLQVLQCIRNFYDTHSCRKLSEDFNFNDQETQEFYADQIFCHSEDNVKPLTETLCSAFYMVGIRDGCVMYDTLS